ncbi:hypothetical protein GA0061074_1258 [Weissella bombi]|uniref:Uncharacterized protein n=1 Tax=Weissella bombi TaxID=1505725 RepID=A0A1C4C1I7_9LACO|nr:hypothetical protein GA0061074_11924 [Weissella bombi]SCC14906.1 hypothetical protein GA0061074_1258 [Weissella bombi]
MTLNNSFINDVKDAIENKSFNVAVPDTSNTNEVVQFLIRNGLSITSIDEYFTGQYSVSFTKIR